MQESEAWNQPSPLSATDGVHLLSTLEGKLAPAERRLRDACFRQARTFVDRVRQAGGLSATYIRSFTVADDTQGRRVDVEIRAGRAFVP